MKPLYEAKDRIQAQILKDQLASHHIETVILGDYLSGAAGELAAMQFPVIWVLEDRDYARGRELIELYLEYSVAEGSEDSWTCHRCGETVDAEFSICWNCTASRS